MTEDETLKVKFLVIRFSSIGDIVLTTPILRCLKNQVENAEVHFITKPQYIEIIRYNPYIDKILTLKSFSETISDIKQENYDYIIDLHNNIRTLRLKHKLKILDFSFPKLNYKKWLLVNFKINKLPNIHVVDRYFETVKLFDVENDNKGLDFFINQNNEVNIDDLCKNIEQKFAVYAIGGRHFTKKMPPKMIAQVCENQKFPIILLGGKEDFENGEIIKNNSEKIFNLCGKLNILQSASVIKQAKAMLSHDTGLMHIGAAFKKNIISIWGNTVPEFGMYPYFPGKKSEKTQPFNIKCRPCSKIGFERCPKKHFNCMKSHGIKEIREKIIKLMTDEEDL
ncbi:MAG: glycosyltransferase family 9 protein [Bacteroidales bacterium]|jgi:heptosyltransferase-2|nr:glycosyltransferase family 9 protein [Bacteroidales bacterium]